MFAKTDCKQVSFCTFRGPDASCVPGKKIIHPPNDCKVSCARNKACSSSNISSPDTTPSRRAGKTRVNRFSIRARDFLTQQSLESLLIIPVACSSGTSRCVFDNGIAAITDKIIRRINRELSVSHLDFYHKHIKTAQLSSVRRKLTEWGSKFGEQWINEEGHLIA
jgi:hypothetical protein